MKSFQVGEFSILPNNKAGTGLFPFGKTFHVFFSSIKMAHKDRYGPLMLQFGIAFPFACSILLLQGGCRNENGKPQEVTQHYETGQISRRYYTVNGKKEGIMTDYYPDGSKKGERLFTDDLQHGRTVLYYPGGQVQEVQYYENGLREKGDTIWYEDGSIQFVTTFKQGKKHGYLRKWAPGGSLTFEAKYEMNTVTEINGELLSIPIKSDTLPTN